MSKGLLHGQINNNAIHSRKQGSNMNRIKAIVALLLVICVFFTVACNGSRKGAERNEDWDYRSHEAGSGYFAGKYAGHAPGDQGRNGVRPSVLRNLQSKQQKIPPVWYSSCWSIGEMVTVGLDAKHPFGCYEEGICSFKKNIACFCCLLSYVS